MKWVFIIPSNYKYIWAFDLWITIYVCSFLICFQVSKEKLEKFVRGRYMNIIKTWINLNFFLFSVTPTLCTKISRKLKQTSNLLNYRTNHAYVLQSNLCMEIFWCEHQEIQQHTVFPKTLNPQVCHPSLEARRSLPEMNENFY